MSIEQYKNAITNTVNHFMPGLDWRYVAAQIQQESSWVEDARSPVGAMGLMQIMPATWEESVRELNIGNLTPDNAVDNICVGVYYLKKCHDTWSWPRPEIDRLCLALASYNAGAGHLINAQKAAGDPSDYASIISALPGITGHHAKETTQYVEKILDYYNQIVTAGW